MGHILLMHQQKWICAFQEMDHKKIGDFFEENGGD